MSYEKYKHDWYISHRLPIKNRKCLVCDNVFQSRDSNRLKKYCSISCNSKSFRIRRRVSLIHGGILDLKTKRDALGRFSVGHKRSPIWVASQKEKISGSKNTSWKGGVTSANEKIRKSTEYDKWRINHLIASNYTCLRCKKRGGKLNVDHILPFSKFPKWRLEFINGRVLCEDCHKTVTSRWNKLKTLTII